MPATTMDVRIDGIRALQKKLKSLGRNWTPAVKKALFQETTIVQDDAIERTPKDEGELRGSYEMKVTGGRTAGRKRVQARITVGGTAQPYARKVHELGPREGGPGEAFFLKNALDAVRHTISARLAARIKQNHGLR